jgi:hypothetical protein
MVPTYDVGASIDWALKYSRDARWDVVGRAMQVLEAMFVRKANDDGWHTLLPPASAATSSSTTTPATAGLFTKRLVALMKTVMRRNAGGNSTSPNRGKLTDLYLSPGGPRGHPQLGPDPGRRRTRRQIFMAGEEGGLTKIFGVTLHDIDELGVGQDYQNYYDERPGRHAADRQGRNRRRPGPRQPRLFVMPDPGRGRGLRGPDLPPPAPGRRVRLGRARLRGPRQPPRSRAGVPSTRTPSWSSSPARPATSLARQS